MEVRPPLDAWKHVSRKIVALELRITRSLRRTGSPKSATPKPIAEHDDPPMFARIGVIRMLNPSRRAGVQPVVQRAALGASQAGPRPLTFPNAIIGMSSYKRTIDIFA